MSTLNVSMPEAMRDYVEQQAHRGQYSASEYIRHLIRQDQMQQAEVEKNWLWELLAISAKELDNDDVSEATAETIIADGRARRAAEA